MSISASNNNVLIFTDFDGTLLDHFTYSFEAALPCLKRLAKLGIPVIPNTSKTFAEVTRLQMAMELSTPLIVENGAAIYIPKNFLPEKPQDAVCIDGYWVKTFAQNRSYWQDVINKVKALHIGQFETFGEMSIERISELTGLDSKNANLAAQRQFGEPVLWKGTDFQQKQFIEKVKSLGAFPLLGGRFLHISGDSNKGRALTWLLAEYRRQHPFLDVSSIALGDGNNDIDMLEVADIAVRISSPAHTPPRLTRTNNVYTSVAFGPQGWQEILNELIPETNKDRT